ncbi:AraC-type DNA-binding protein [Cnuella takakiae]|uniref:AraC-type DNA-binding protein n=1 Tax=Cnuella takakiae TaxID=1302690 RepID=A0A1M5BDG2_9BACT|nr:response regulator transcription factor [Cnuella takakiae]OLY93442.1 hypothetical protein BUE76_17285 [Cnuella takakiae]SHF40583.1 AraC-type DNA-binding protein [Cnuella takakiae]
MNPSVLIVEDSLLDRHFFKTCLAQDFNLNFASNGLEGLQMLRTFKPDLIITDVMMPECDGLHFVNQLRKEYPQNDVPIIAVTGSTDQAITEALLAMGVLGLAHKPLMPKPFCQQMKNLVNLRQQIRQMAKEEKVQPVLRRVPEDDFIKDFDTVVQDYIPVQEVSLGEIARKLNVSIPTLLRKVKQHYGCSPMKLISDAKLEQAHRLLQTEQLSVKDAAFETGFVSTSYFIKAYKKKYGKTPGTLLIRN